MTGKVLNVGFDASPAEVTLLKSGGITATVQLPDVLLTTADASQSGSEKFFYIP